MGPYSPDWHGQGSNRELISTGTGTNLMEFMFALSNLIRACHNDSSQNKSVPPPNSLEPLMLRSPRDTKFLYKADFFFCLLKQAYNSDANIQICKHLTWEDEQRTEWLLSLILQIKTDNHFFTKNFLEILLHLLAVEDSISQWRVALALNYNGRGFMYHLHHYINKTRQYYYPTTYNDIEKIIMLYEFLWKLININPVVAGWIKHIANECISPLESLFEEILSNFNRYSLSDDISLPHTSNLYNNLKQFLKGESNNITVLPYPEDFSLQNCSISNVTNRDDECN
jgi:hypothetical protein